MLQPGLHDAHRTPGRAVQVQIPLVLLRQVRRVLQGRASFDMLVKGECEERAIGMCEFRHARKQSESARKELTI